MSLQCGFFDSTELVETPGGYPRGNKAKDAAFFARYFASFVGSGVFFTPAACFSVTPGSGMNLSVQPGTAFLKGYLCYDDSPATLSLSADTADHVYWILLRLNLTDGAITLTSVSDPTAGTLPSRSDTLFDLVLAKVSVPAGSVSVTAAMITDCRGDPALCGYVRSLVDAIGSLVDYATVAGTLAGILPLSAGGTGASDAPSARQQLGLGDAALKTVDTPLGVPTLNAAGKLRAEQASAAIVSVSASRALTLTDAGCFLWINRVSDTVLTLPSAASAAFPVGTEMEICQYGVGSVTVTPAAGVTLNGASASVTLSRSFGTAVLKKLDTNVWLAGGSLA